MIVSLIVAMARNRVIGRDGDLPWRLPDDMRFFKATTLGHHVIMGRKTWRSLERPLPKRVNMVVSNQLDPATQGARVFPTLDGALDAAERAGEMEAFVIGGAQLYQAALPLAHRLYLTQVEAEVDGDILFPKIDWAQWQEQSSSRHEIDSSHAFAFTTRLLQRIGM